MAMALGLRFRDGRRPIRDVKLLTLVGVCVRFHGVSVVSANLQGYANTDYFEPRLPGLFVVWRMLNLLQVLDDELLDGASLLRSDP